MTWVTSHKARLSKTGTAVLKVPLDHELLPFRTSLSAVNGYHAYES